MASPQRDPVLLPAVLLVWAAVLLFVLYPMARLVLLTFWDGGPTLGAVRGLVGDWQHRAALWNSLLLAGLVGVAGTALGLAFALLTVRANLPRWVGRVIDAIVLLPLISPPFTAAIALIFSLGPRGLLSYHVLGITGLNIYGLSGTWLSETLTYFPIAYLTIKGVLANVDPNLEDSAFSLGARRLRVFATVTAPLATPGLANSFLLVSAASLADFATPLILGGTKFPVLPTQAFLQITGLYDMRGGAALCFLLLVPALAIFIGQRRWTEGRDGSFVVVTGKVGAATRIKSLSPLAIATLGVVCGAVVLLVLFFYGVILAASLVRALGADNTLSLTHYQHVFSGGLKAVRDTLIIATLAMPAGGFFAVLLGYLVARTRFPGRRALEFAAMVNYAVPGTIVGIAYLIAFNDPPLALTGTAFILVVCYVFRYSLAGTRATTALLAQIDPSLEEASASLGARRDTTFRRVVLPLIRPALLAGMTVLFIRGMTAISATIFLVSLNWSLVTVRILEGITNLELGQASAFSMVVIALVYAAVVVTTVIMRRLHAGSVGQAGMLLWRLTGMRLRLERVSKRFTRQGAGDVAAVNDVSLTVEPGELMTLLGPSGCGKTTTLRMVAGFEQPDEGRVFIGEADVTGLMVYRRNIGFVFQNYALFPHLSVFDNVAYGLRVRGLASAALRSRVGQVLELVGLPGYESRYPNQLSGGEQQRVAVARAVVIEPALLLFDEPLSNLDARLRVQMRDELSRLQRQLRITTVYVTHDQEEAMALSDRIAVMRHGRVAQLGTAEDLYRAPASSFVAEFIGRVNLVPARAGHAADGGVDTELWGAKVRVHADPGCAPGQALVLVLRPELLDLLSETAKVPRGQVAAAGVVRSRTFLGEKVEYVVDVQGTALQAVTYDPARRGLFPAGARVQVACDPSFVRSLPDDPR